MGTDVAVALLAFLSTPASLLVHAVVYNWVMLRKFTIVLHEHVKIFLSLYLRSHSFGWLKSNHKTVLLNCLKQTLT